MPSPDDETLPSTLSAYSGTAAAPQPEPVLSFDGVSLSFGERLLWHDLNARILPGEFVAVLGPNGSGKTSLLKVLLGQNRISSGHVLVNGHEVKTGDPDIGYVPQQKGVAASTPMRARDLVALGIDGHRLGVRLGKRKIERRVTELLDSVGALPYADAPIGTLSGGELQRLRLAQSLASNPRLLLCDEPLLSLDMTHQHLVARLLDEERRANETAILFVTHEINPILPYVDKVIYIAGGHFLVGTPDEVLNSDSLSGLFGSRIEVMDVGGRVVVVGGNGPLAHDPRREVRSGSPTGGPCQSQPAAHPGHLHDMGTGRGETR